MLAPNVAIYTAGHPLHPVSRQFSITNTEFPLPLETMFWIGGNAVILPGVTIGNNVVIGAGSVVDERYSRLVSGNQAIPVGY